MNAESEIAIKQNELAIKKAELKKESDVKKAEADAAYKIQEEEQRKTWRSPPPMPILPSRRRKSF